jgi:hypothetical protein
MVASPGIGAVGIDASGDPFQRLFLAANRRGRPCGQTAGLSTRTGNNEQHSGNTLAAADE